MYIYLFICPIITLLLILSGYVVFKSLYLVTDNGKSTNSITIYIGFVCLSNNLYNSSTQS